MGEYRSEIRSSAIEKLENKVASGNYAHYLRRVTLKRVRRFSDRVVSFDFPVTALIGPNGGGKTTILGAAGLIYRGITPGTFFAKSGRYDASMKDWSIEYEVIDKTTSPRLPLQRTASFPSLKWNRKAIKRPVLHFGVSRTVAATERKELIKAIGNKFVAQDEVALPTAVVSEVEKILAKDMQGCNRLSIDAQGKATLYAARNSDGSEYSEFHFGAGEASVIRIVSAIEEAPDGALILIEEIENGLHPIATQHLVEYLIDVCLRKSCQAIFTTHSNDALAPLPSRAIWASYNGEVVQGKLDIKSLRTITGQIDAKLAIFVEDSFAELMVATALRYHGGIELDAVKIHGMGGEDPAKQVNRQHNVDPTSSFPSICILDGDQSTKVDPAYREFALPGDGAPEAHVFDVILDRLDYVAARLTVSMQLPTSAQERVKQVVRNRALTNRDRHVVFEQIGEDLDFTSGLVVASAFLAIWAQERPSEVAALVSEFIDLAPRRE
ncbi:ATP-dependent nuclease [Nocardia farcinica]|uniref:ATP-dependent nuclease n=1 Tax=Nocardia farcinica TaxID=37329 RepID=UPI00245417D4|nr:AAA family ATPase [Nocardia farcinica]